MIRWIKCERSGSLKTLILVAHPKEQDSATQAFLKQALTAATDPEIKRRVLQMPNEAGFNAQTEMKDVLAAERLIFQFPLYWYSAPAIMQQWLTDCLLSPYKEKLRGKELGLVVSTGRPLAEFSMGKRQHYSLSELLRPLAAVADNLGMQQMPYFLVAQFAYQTECEHQQLLFDYLQYLELPRDPSFAQREEWWSTNLKRLAQKITDPQKKQTLSLLESQIIERSERLVELKDEVAMIKQVEEGDL